MKNLFKASIFYTICAALVGLSIVFVNIMRTTDKGVALQLEEQRTDQKRYEMEIWKAKASIASSQGNVSVWKSDDPSKEILASEQKQTLDLSGTDNCEGKPSTSVNADTQSLRVNGKSCVLLRLSGSVTTLQGKWYEIAVPVPNVPNNYYKCGTVDGRNDSESKCAQFATRYSGREMYITVFEGGYVNF